MEASKSYYVFIFIMFIAHYASANNSIEELNDLLLKENRVASNIKIENGKEYIAQVLQEFITELEEYGFCNFEFSNFTQLIHRTNYFGYNVSGNIDYTNGFINSIQQVSIKIDFTDGNIDSDKQTVTFSTNFIISSINFLFNYAANLTEGNFTGTVVIPMDTIEVEMTIVNYFNGTISTDFHIMSLSGGIPKKWAFEPSNHYIEIINREVTLDVREDLDRIMDTQWKMLLKKVIDRIPFPEICFFCSR